MASKRKKAGAGASLLELVQAEADEASLSGKNRVVLMELRQEIEDVLRRGYKWKVVWQALQKAERIDMSYDTFRAHCRAMGLETVPKSTVKPTSTKPAKKKRK